MLGFKSLFCDWGNSKGKNFLFLSQKLGNLIKNLFFFSLGFFGFFFPGGFFPYVANGKFRGGADFGILIFLAALGR